MGICTNCGAIINNEDLDKHKCDLLNCPIKDKEKIPTTTEKDIIKGE